jgi:hypothetical protein
MIWDYGCGTCGRSRRNTKIELDEEEYSRDC